MARTLRALLAVSSLSVYLPICTQAHMQMSWPYPLRSPLDPAVSGNDKDYNMISPLNADGSNFPCKHYQDLATNPQANDIKATYQAGDTYNLTLAGTATHMGGSCQISISYDNAATFKVIESIIGGCPLNKTYNFTIPSFAPSSDTALLSWSWFNIVGNREMYQNCARVQILSTPVQRYRRTTYKRQATIDDLPDMFACNVGNGCKTIERREVVFPDPGNSILYGQDAITPDPGPGFTSNGTAATNSSSAETGSSMPSVAPAPYLMGNETMVVDASGTAIKYGTAYATGAAYPTGAALYSKNSTMTPKNTTESANAMMTSTPTTSTTPANSVGGVARLPVTSMTTTRPTTSMTTPSTFSTMTTPRVNSGAIATPASNALSGSCTPGTFACNSPTTFSQCVSSGSGTTSYTYMGSVAAGMQCVAGAITRQNAGPCTPSGSIFCKGNNAFYMCDQGGLIDMGPVAVGTTCVNGVISIA